MEKRFIVLGVLIASMSASVFAIGRIGPPTAEHRQGQFGFDLGYTYSREDLDKQRPKVSSTWTQSWTGEEYFGEVQVGEEQFVTLDRWLVTDTETWVENELTGAEYGSGRYLDGFEQDGTPIYETWDESDDATMMTSFTKFKFDKLKTSRIFSTLSYGISTDWEVFGTLGFAQIETGASGGAASWDLDPNGVPTGDPYDETRLGYQFDDNSPFVGIGTKYTFLRQDNIKWGAALQGNWLKAKGDMTSRMVWSDEGEGGMWTDEDRIRDAYEVEYWEIMLAVGPTIDMGNWKLYGGPFFYWLTGDMEGRSVDRESGTYEFSGEGEVRGQWSETETTKLSADIKAKSNFGGFIGAQVDLGNNKRLGGEFAHNGNGYAFSANIGMSF